jgi:hypothetical protein
MWRINKVELVDGATDQMRANSTASVPIHLDKTCHSLAFHLYQQQLSQLSPLLAQLNSSIPHIAVQPSLSTLYGGFQNHHSFLPVDVLSQLRLQAELNGSRNHLNHILFEMQRQQTCVMMPQPAPVNEQKIFDTERSTIYETDNHSTSTIATATISTICASTPNVSIPPNQKDQLVSNQNISRKVEIRKAKPTRKRSLPSTSGDLHNKFDSKWYASYGRLKCFKQLTGHTIVPRGYSHDPKLASWVRKTVILFDMDLTVKQN